MIIIQSKKVISKLIISNNFNIFAISTFKNEVSNIGRDAVDIECVSLVQVLLTTLHTSDCLQLAD